MNAILKGGPERKKEALYSFDLPLILFSFITALYSITPKSFFMGAVHQIETWSARHHPKWLVVFRVALGLCLFIKGIQFIYNSILLDRIFAGSAFLSNFSWLSAIIPYVHLLGGALLVPGLFTRFICLIHIPILLGAVFFVNIKQGFFSGGSDLLFSIVILLLLCLFAIEGGGRFSLDHRYFNKHLADEN